jgi:hypothetical protein
MGTTGCQQFAKSNEELGLAIYGKDRAVNAGLFVFPGEASLNLIDNAAHPPAVMGLRPDSGTSLRLLAPDGKVVWKAP